MRALLLSVLLVGCGHARPAAESAPTAPEEALDVHCDAGDARACYELGEQLAASGDARVESVSRFATACWGGAVLGCRNAEALLAPTADGASPLFRELETACDGHTVEACRLLGWSRLHAVGISRDADGAAAVLRPLCAQGDAPSCMVLGNGLRRQFIAPEGDETPRGLYDRACRAGFIPGCSEYVAALLEHGTADDRPEARRVAEAGCARGDLMSCTHLGFVLVEAGEAAAAVGLLDRTCEQGLPIACVHLATMFLKGAVVPRDERRGLALMDVGCQWDLGHACLTAGTYHLNGPFPNPGKALASFKRAWDLGSPEAAGYIGHMYLHEIGVPQDRDHAMNAYTFACAKGDQASCTALGQELLVDDDPEMPPVGAIRLQMACMADHVPACYVLGMALGPKGIPSLRNDERSAMYLSMACGMGEARACAALPAR